MPVFLCSKCKVMENTAGSNYWTREFLHGDGAPALCTECDPEIRKWHGMFERRQMPEDHVVGPDGFVYQKDDPYLGRLRKER